MALDDRIAAAAPSCYITSLERLFATIGPQDAEQNITGQVAFGMDHADYATLRAPRPTLFCVGTRDFFDIQGSWDTFREVKRIYGRLGFGERVDLFESDEPHGFTQPTARGRDALAPPLAREGRTTPRSRAISRSPPTQQLQCTRTGQVLQRPARQVGLRPQRRARGRAGPAAGRSPGAARQGRPARARSAA